MNDSSPAAVCNIRLLVMDVDGTLTDGRIYMGVDGELLKVFDVKDGYAIRNMLSDLGIVPAVITGRRSEQVTLRCRELGIGECHQGVADKTDCLAKVAEDRHLSLSEVAYIGDDLNDLPCMRLVSSAGGVVGCPSDACREVVEEADFVASSPGGRGAVREFIEWIGKRDFRFSF